MAATPAVPAAAGVALPDRLYGRPGAEQLHDDPAGVWENDIEPDGDVRDDGWIVEEWTVRSPRTHLPSADWVVEHIMDYWLAENAELDEYGFDAFDNAAKESEMEPVLQAWADRIQYRMADTFVSNHIVTLVDGEPHLDGEPMYVKRVSDD